MRTDLPAPTALAGPQPWRENALTPQPPLPGGGAGERSPRVAVIDYGAGNLRSIRRALEAAGAVVEVTAAPSVVAAADAVVFPGVGAAGAAMARLGELGLVPTIREAVAGGTPFLGICLGAQLLFGAQEEGETAGLGLLPGRVRRLRGGVKVPHMGWNRSRVVRSGPLGEAGDEWEYYFVHSYVVEPEDAADVAAVVDYGETFPSVVVRGHVWGTQFHPEKSGRDGLALVRAWVEGIGETARTAPPAPQAWGENDERSRRSRREGPRPSAPALRREGTSAAETARVDESQTPRVVSA